VHAIELERFVGDSASKLDAARRKSESIAGSRTQLEADKASLSATLLSVQRGIEEHDNHNRRLEAKNTQLKADIREKQREIQAAVALKTNLLQQITKSEEQLEEVKKKAGRLETTSRAKEEELKALLNEVEHEDKRLTDRLAALQKQVERERGELFSGEDIHLDPEILKYKGLVEVAEVDLVKSPPRKRARAF